MCTYIYLSLIHFDRNFQYQPSILGDPPWLWKAPWLFFLWRWNRRGVSMNPTITPTRWRGGAYRAISVVSYSLVTRNA